MREPVSCALVAGHSGHHKGVSLPTSMSKTHSHWEWSDDPEPDSDRAGVPEDAAEMGPAAIASFSGRVFDGSNEGVQGLLPPGLPIVDPWRHAGLRFRLGLIGCTIGLALAMVSLWLFLDQPRWQFAVWMGVGFVIAGVASVPTGAAIGDYQRRVANLSKNSAHRTTRE